MVRKTIILFATLIVGASLTDAFAVPSVRQLGTNVSTNTEKPIAVLPSLPKASNPEVVRAVKTQTETDDTVRIPSISTIKTISSARIKQPVIPSEIQPVTSGVSEASFNAVVDRVNALEQQSENALTGVTESGTGNYVTGVTVGSGNKLEVSKTRVLYAPVFQGNYDTGSNAEIWVVK